MGQLPGDTCIAFDYKKKEVAVAYEGKIQIGKR